MKQVQICPTAIDACYESEAVVIATEWKEFTTLDWQDIYDNMRKPAFIFDGRLLVDTDKLTKIGFKVNQLSSDSNQLTSDHSFRFPASDVVQNSPNDAFIDAILGSDTSLVFFCYEAIS